MSEENIALVRRSTQAYNDRDLDALESTFCEDVVMRQHDLSAAAAWGAEFRGRDAYIRWFRDMIYTLAARVEIETIHAIYDRVVVVYSALGSGDSSGAPVTLRYAQVYSFRDGLISAVDYYWPAEEALNGVGLEE